MFFLFFPKSVPNLLSEFLGVDFGSILERFGDPFSTILGARSPKNQRSKRYPTICVRCSRHIGSRASCLGSWEGLGAWKARMPVPVLTAVSRC